MNVISPSKYWLYGFAAVLIIILPVLYIPIYMESANRIVLILTGMGLLASFLILLLNFNAGPHSRHFAETIVGLVLVIGWSASLALLIWPAYKEANLFLNLVHQSIYPITAIVFTRISWERRIPAEQALWVTITLVLIIPVLIDTSNLVPTTVSSTDLAGLQFLSGALLMAALTVTARQRAMNGDVNPLQLAFLIFTCVHWVSFAMGDLVSRPIPQLDIFLALTQTAAVIAVLLLYVHHLLMTPLFEKAQMLENSQKAYKDLRRVVDQVPAGLLWKDKNSIFMGGNRVFLDAVGLADESELIGLSEYDLKQGVAEEFVAQDHRVFTSGNALLETYERYRLPGDRVTYNRISRAPLRDDDGNIIGIIAFYSEVEQIDENGKIFRAPTKFNEDMRPYLGYGKLFTLFEHPNDISDEHAKNYIDHLKFDD